MYTIKNTDSDLKKKLYNLLLSFSNDNDFITGMMCNVSTDIMRKEIIEYIQKNPNANEEELLTCSVYLDNGLKIN